MNDRRPHRYHLLDATRGVAAIGVLLFHSYSNWISHEAVGWTALLRWLIENGWRGVQVFFVVSGYCVAERLANEHSRNGSARRFLLDRLLRIAPPYWAALALALLLDLAAMPFNGKPLFSDMVGSAGIFNVTNRVAQMLTLVEPWLNKTPFLIVSWTLSFEVMFYAIAALGLAAANLAGRMQWSFLTGLMLALLGMIPSVSSWCPVLGLWPQFFLGMTAWWLVNRTAGAANRLTLATVLFCIAVVVGDLCKPSPGASLELAAITGWMIVVLYPFDGFISRLPLVRWAGSVGLWSYSLYLIHVPIVSKSRNLLGRWFEHTRLGFVLPGLCAVLAMVVAWYFFKYVESRFEDHRKRLLKKWWPTGGSNSASPARLHEAQNLSAIPPHPLHETPV